MNKLAAITTTVLISMACSSNYKQIIPASELQYVKGPTPLFIFWGQSQIADSHSLDLKLEFIDEYERIHGVRPEVVNCAWGGSSIAKWQPGGTLMDRCAKMVAAKLATGQYTVYGLAGSHGENDARYGGWEIYSTMLRITLNEFRIYFPNVPIVMTQIGRHEGWVASDEAWASIQDQQWEVVWSMSNAMMFETKSFVVLEVDGVHNDDATDAIIGGMIAGYF